MESLLSLQLFSQPNLRLFQVISACYEKRSVIFTTNLEFSKWNGIFYDEIRQPPSLPFSSPQSFTGLFRTKLSFASFYYERLVLELRVLQKLTSGMLQIHIAKHTQKWNSLKRKASIRLISGIYSTSWVSCILSSSIDSCPKRIFLSSMG